MTEAPAPLHDDRESSARIVWRLAWPAVSLNTLQTVNALLDSYFVQHLPTANLTAIGAATTTVFLFVSISFAMAVASTALVSRSFGAQDRQAYVEANAKCLAMAIYLGFALALVMVPAGHLTSLAVLPPGAKEAQGLMSGYVSLFAMSLPALFVVQTLAGSMRGIGDTKSPMVISGLQILVHIVLNATLINPTVRLGPVIINGFGMGLAGAAWAVVASSWIAAGVYLYWTTKTPLGGSNCLIWPGMYWIRRILNITLPAATMAFVRVTSLMAFSAVLGRVPGGQTAIAAMRPGFSIESLAFMPAFGLSVSASALVGQSLGMKDPARASRLAWTAAHHAALVSLAASVFLVVFAQQVSGLLLGDQPEVQSIVVRFIYFICATEILFAYAMVLIGAMQGAGDTKRPLGLSVLCLWGLRVPLAMLFALLFGMGADGCWLSMSVTQGLQGLLSIGLWRSGHWRHVTV